METKKIYSITAQWFEVKVKGSAFDDSGTLKSMTRKYVIDANTWTECENNTIERCFEDFQGDTTIVDMSIAPYTEVVFSNNDSDDKWFKVKVYLITEDDRGKEKRQAVYYLTNSDSTSGAEDNIKTMFSDTLLEYVIGGVTDTVITEVHVFNKAVSI